MGADDLQIRTVAENKSPTSDKGYRSNLVAGRGANNASLHKKFTKLQASLKARDFLNGRAIGTLS
jgi:hypothetical protein